MEKIIRAKTPSWVREHVEAAIAVIGDNPERIGSFLANLPMIGQPSEKLFQSHGYFVHWGAEEKPWMTIQPRVCEMNKGELVMLFA